MKQVLWLFPVLFLYQCVGAKAVDPGTEREFSVVGNPHSPLLKTDAEGFYRSLGATGEEAQSISRSYASQAPPVADNTVSGFFSGSWQYKTVSISDWNITGTFPADFLWGTAIAAHQVEGENSNNDWWSFETYCDGPFEWVNLCFPKGIVNSGRATDHYSRFRDSDLDLAKNLGLNTFRMSMEWSRIEPMKGVFSADATRYYRNYLLALKARGLKPMVTLWHFTLPKWVQNPGVYYDIFGRHDQMDKSLGGWKNPQTVQEFAKFAQYCAENFGDLVDIWVTHNEPIGTLMVGHMAGYFPPGFLLDFSSTKKAVLNAARAHNAAYDMIKTYDTQDADGDGVKSRIGLVQHYRKFLPENTGNADDLQATRRLEYFYHYHMLDAAYTGKLDTDFDGEGDEVLGDGKRKIDFVGVNYYSTFMVSPGYAANVLVRITGGYKELGGAVWIPDNNSPAVPHNSLGWQIYPNGFYDVLMDTHNRYHLPMIVTENGMADAVGTTNKRAQYVISHLQMMLKARSQGADIRGYYLWTLTDNFEWREAFNAKARFGLYQVLHGSDHTEYTDSLTRVATPSVRAYSDIISAGGISSTNISRYGTFPQIPVP